MKVYSKLFKINHNTNRPHIPDHPYRILIIVVLGSSKTIKLLNLIKYQQPDMI